MTLTEPDLQWIKDLKIYFSEKISVKPSPLGGFGVFNNTNEVIPEDDILITIPKDSVLSPKSCAAGDILSQYSGELDPHILLVLAYLFEKSRSVESPWYGFINFINNVPFPDVTMKWSENELKWLKGTNLNIWEPMDMDELSEHYQDCETVFKELSVVPGFIAPTFPEFADAWILVGSRSFDVDNYHQLGLVPSACLFNHSDKETVHFETDGEVCPACGALSCGCVFEDDSMSGGESDSNVENEDESMDEGIDEGSESASEGSEDEASGSEDEGNSESDDMEIDGQEDLAVCEFRVCRDIPPKSEIFNTYGEDPNGNLVSRYGFAILDNAHDVVDFQPEVIELGYKNEEDDEDELEDDDDLVGIVSTEDGIEVSEGLQYLAESKDMTVLDLLDTLCATRKSKYSAPIEPSANELANNQRYQIALTAVQTELNLMDKALKFYTESSKNQEKN